MNYGYRFDTPDAKALLERLVGKPLDQLDADQLYCISKLIRQGRRLRQNVALRNYMSSLFPHARIKEVSKTYTDRFGNEKPSKVLVFEVDGKENETEVAEEEE